MRSIKAMLAAALALGSHALQAAPAARAKTGSGVLEGVRANSLAVYRGVPFAAAPVDTLRWRAPQQVKSWAGVRQAATFAPACMQTSVSMPGETPPKVSEDCLYLNVWTPALRRGTRLPVMVWIHGGSFSSGSASMPLFWGDRLVKRGVILGTVAYRLGPLGFLAHPELSR